jgi:hypothetical protein
VALFASVHVVAFAVAEVLPFPAPKVKVAVPVVFAIVTEFDELKPWLKDMELA